jgi:signal transduction histidine kinase
VVRKWLLPTLSEILAKAEPTGIDLQVPEIGETPADLTAEDRFNAELHAHTQWQTAIAAVEDLLLKVLPPIAPISWCDEDLSRLGLLITAPSPLFDRLAIASQLQVVSFTDGNSNLQLPPCDRGDCEEIDLSSARSIPLLSTDPLAAEKFCLVFTSYFSLVVVLGEDRGVPRCQFSFNPEDLAVVWQSLRGRMMLTSPDLLADLDNLVAEFPPIAPDYRWVMTFSQQLLQHLPTAPTATVTNIVTPEVNAIAFGAPLGAIAQARATSAIERVNTANSTVDLELLQALTHEIRTPLTTIRTMTRSLLRQPDLAPRVMQRLESIDRECTEQINRMELIFSAVELATTQPQAVDLTTMSLSSLLEQSLPLWKKQAERRNLNLAVAIPQKLPAVVSNPTMLDRVLTGLVENFTRNLPAGSHIQVEVTPVGDRLKLQLQSQLEAEEQASPAQGLSIGQLLTFQPETGNLSLNMNVTKNLFQILGSKLIVRQNPQQGEVLTIFLPLSTIELGNRG